MERPQLGQWCLISAIATKDKIGNSVKWESEEIEAPIRAMFIGKRMVYSGKMERETIQESWEYPAYEGELFFSRSKQHEVWLFVRNANQNLFRAFPDSVQLIESGE